MVVDQQIKEIVGTLRESLPASDHAEICSLGGLFFYLSKDSRYEGVVDIQKILRAESNAHDVLIQTLRKIESEIPYFKGVFDVMMDVLNRLESSQITRFFYELSSINSNLEVSEWLDEALKMASAESGNRGMEMITPDSINKLAISILDPKKGSFYDGVAGYGGNLLEAQRHAQKQNNSLKLYGQEINEKAWAILKIRLFVFGDEENQIVQGDVLSEPGFAEDNTLKKFDYVYMDVPFSMRINNYESIEKDQYNRFFYGMPPRSKGDYAFISQALASLNEEGRAIVTTTEGALFRGAAEGRVRKNIILSDVIEAVISLPPGLYNAASIPVNLVVFNKNKVESRKNKILFVKADELFTEQSRNRRTISDVDIKKIVDAVQDGSEINEFSTYIHVSDLTDYNLNPSRYLLPSEVDIEGFGTVNFNLKAFEDIDTVPLKEVASFFRGYNVGSKNKESADGEFRIVRLSDVQNGKLMMDTISRYDIENNARISMYELQEDDVIISIRGNSLKTATIPADTEGLLLSQNFIGIRCKSRLNPDFLKVYLESPLGQYLLTNKMAGTAIPTLSRKDIETLEIPLPSIEEQNKIMDQYNAKEMHVEKEIERLKTELMEMKLQTYTQMGIKDVFSI